MWNQGLESNDWPKNKKTSASATLVATSVKIKGKRERLKVWHRKVSGAPNHVEPQINFKPLMRGALPGRAASSQSPCSSQQELLYTAILTTLSLPKTGRHTHTSHCLSSSFVLLFIWSLALNVWLIEQHIIRGTIKMSALITSGKSHPRCSASVGGINTSVARRSLGPTQTCSLLIAILRIVVAANLYSQRHLQCRFTNGVVCVRTLPCRHHLRVWAMKLFPGTRMNGAEEIEAPGGEFSHLCWQLLEKHQYSCFFFFWRGKCSPETWWTNTSLFPVCVLHSLCTSSWNKKSTVYYGMVVWLYYGDDLSGLSERLGCNLISFASCPTLCTSLRETNSRSKWLRL